MPVEYDVVVVGGGPAGSSCAWRLRQAGRSVLVWDGKQFPRDKICAGWVTPQVFEALEIAPSDYDTGGRVLQRIEGFQVGQLGGGETRVDYARTVSYGIRRCEFDNFLLRRSGARMRLGEPVRSLVRKNGGWVVNGEVTTPFLVGAGGHFCPVARHLGAPLGRRESIIAAQEIELEMTAAEREKCRVDQDLPEIYFTADLLGYGWVFRKGSFINVGLGRQDSHRLGEHVSRFLELLAERRKVPASLPAKFCGHPYLLYDHATRPLTADGALLIGDAAGLAYPRSGEGIRPAVESGLLAAETILECGPAHDRQALKPYEERITARFGQRGPSRAITDLVPPRILRALAGRLLSTEWFARHVVLDQWFFHRKQAALGAATERDFPAASCVPESR